MAQAFSPLTSEQAKHVQRTAAEALGLPVTAEIDLGKGVTLKMAFIPPGEFLMGSPDGEEGRCDTEGPQHSVEIRNGFYIGTYPATQRQWQGVTGSNPSEFRGEENPVEQVSWHECQEFIQKLNLRCNAELRLPTEAEWEYACRAGTATRFYSGDSDSGLGEVAWYGANSGRKTHPAGQKRPNAWGVYDMHGNVWEWCQSLYKPYPYRADDGRETLTASGDRMLRGGSWFFRASICRSACRISYDPVSRPGIFGFRPVAVLSAQE